MTRDDLYAHYRRYYTPNNAALVVVGDVDAADVVRRADRAFQDVQPAPLPPRVRTVEPPPLGERRVTIEREGTTAYLKVAWSAPPVDDPDFLPMLVLDAVLTGAKGLNVWSSFRSQPPQRRSRLYRGLVETGRASAVGGALIPTAQPFLYTVSATVTDGMSIDEVEGEALAIVERIRTGGVAADEFERARRQLAARFVFENDSVTNIAHQIGFFQTVSSLEALASMSARLAGVTNEQVGVAARMWLAPARRTVGRFVPFPASHHAEDERS
jgi:zinc protease